MIVIQDPILLNVGGIGHHDFIHGETAQSTCSHLKVATGGARLPAWVRGLPRTLGCHRKCCEGEESRSLANNLFANGLAVMSSA